MRRVRPDAYGSPEEWKPRFEPTRLHRPAANKEARRSGRLEPLARIGADGPGHEDAMIEVNGIQPPVAPDPIEPAGAAGPSNPLAEAAASPDVVEISTAARLAARVHAVPDVREDLVQRVKLEIESGTYESPARIERAVTRLMEELFDL